MAAVGTERARQRRDIKSLTWPRAPTTSVTDGLTDGLTDFNTGSLGPTQGEAATAFKTCFQASLQPVSILRALNGTEGEEMRRSAESRWRSGSPPLRGNDVTAAATVAINYKLMD